MTIIQKTGTILFGIVFCFLFFAVARAQDVFVPTTCECRITCSPDRLPSNPLFPRETVRRVGAGLTTQGFLDIMNRGIDEACNNFFSVSETEARRLAAEQSIPELQAPFEPFYDSRSNMLYVVAGSLGRDIDSEYVLGGGCESSGALLSKTYSCADGMGGSGSCFCLPDASGSECFIANPRVLLSCGQKNDRGLNQQEFEQSMSAIYNIQPPEPGEQSEQNYGPGYEPIAWSFPTDKINSLNKVGISGTGTTQVQLLIGRLIKYAVGFLGALALCLVIYSGLKFMLSQGDEGKQGEALKMMLWSGTGIVALLGSYSMVTFVLSILR